MVSERKLSCERVSHPELLRAVQMRFLLRRFGQVMGQSNGSEGTFLLSKPVTSISIFLSHSWATPAWFKTIALMYYANIQRALFAGFLVMGILWVLELSGATGHLLVLNEYHLPSDKKVLHWPASHKYAPGCLAFLLVLVFGQEIPGLPQFRCFLDKCCIHQTDEDRKMKGIHLLGAFLNYSEKLVILWQPEYLTRLWCVYELAAFRHIKGPVDGTIEFFPLKLPLLALGLFLFHALATVIYEFIGPILIYADWHAEWSLETFPAWMRPLYFWAGFFWCLFAGAYPLVAYSLWTTCRSHMDDRRTLLKQLREFKITNAHCLHESDREFVESQIKIWFGSIEKFEHEVRTDIGNLVERQLDEKEPMPWHMIFVGALAHTFFTGSECVDAYVDKDWKMLPHLVLFGIGLSLCADAIGMSVALRIADRARNWGWTTRTTNILGAVLTSALMALSSSFCGLALSPATPMPIAVMVVVLLGVATWLLYFTKCRRRAMQRRGLPQQQQQQQQQQQLQSAGGLSKEAEFYSIESLDLDVDGNNDKTLGALGQDPHGPSKRNEVHLGWEDDLEFGDTCLRGRL